MANAQLPLSLVRTGGRSEAPALAEPSDGQLLKRFIARHDEEAFAALVRRHGPLVLGVCRRVLHDAHAAEDAFQATFLLLARKAATLDRPELLANWLYGVAYRISVKAKARMARRCAHERQTALMPKAEPLSDAELWELRELLDEGMNSLPEKYRAPLVLCYLEGLTNEEAAQRLGWPAGSMSSRLARARELLREKLCRRGVVLTLGLFGAALAQLAAAPELPARLVDVTAKAAVLTVAGKAALTSLPPSVLELAEEAPRASWLGARDLAVAGVLAAILLAAAVAGFAYGRLATPPPATAAPCNGSAGPGPIRALD
jgi:RNA polymerase sigma-70 factor (ECF subfamily)